MTGRHRQANQAIWRRGAAGLGIVVAGVGFLSMPVTSRQGRDFTVRTLRLPLYVKALTFIDRDLQYRQLAREITAGFTGDEARMLAVFAWTREHIRPTPKELPVIDDHILHIIIRGYGEDDQMADVFATLSTYAGVPAFWHVARAEGDRGSLVLCFARVSGRWVMVDVANGFVFTTSDGRLADLNDMLVNPARVREIVGTSMPDGISYTEYLAHLQPFRVPQTLRAEKQMPLRRIWYEVGLRLRLIPAEQVSVSYSQSRGERMRSPLMAFVLYGVAWAQAAR